MQPMGSTKASLTEAFAVFDTDRNGTISSDEFVAVLKRGNSTLSEQDLQEILKEFDVNKDGVLNIEEFITAMTKTGYAGGLVKTPAAYDYSSADPTKWVFEEFVSNGVVQATVDNDTGQIKLVKEKKAGSIVEAKKMFLENPATYEAMLYQTDMINWPVDQQKYTLYHRKGTEGFEAETADGPWTMITAEYEALPKMKELAPSDKDAYTDTDVFMTYERMRLKKPIFPGRGQGVADVPSIKIIGAADPSDVYQGGVGDCWLLSALSSLAEFRGTIRHLFRKTEGIDEMPRDTPNKYTITLWDLPTWTEVDIVVDERLTASASGGLLSCKPSKEGELWCCYLEKAVVAHIGGWQKANGATCPHAWMILTGCREVYTFKRNASGKLTCWGNWDPNKNEWQALFNNPKDNSGIWPMAWPEVGGGGDLHHAVDEDEMFKRMVEWDRSNFILAASTDDVAESSGMVDDHAYSVISVLENVADSGQDLIKMRNPHGRGEFEKGRWDDDGPGWKEYPKVKEQVKPMLDVDNGIFWMSKTEFFKYFSSFYLCARKMI